MDEPWKDWIPGVLNWTQMRELCKTGAVKGNDSLEGAIGKSAIDLSLSCKAFRMTQGSVKPSGPDFYDWFITKWKLAEEIEPFPDGTFTLEAKETYVFELNEKLNIKALETAQIHGQATAKSSVGRVDVLARLIVDGMDTYEGFDPNSLKNHSGHMYLEITPITFSVRVKPNICLSQLRLFRGKPETAEIKGKELFMTVLEGPGAENGILTVDLANVDKGGLPFAAFCEAIGNTPDDPVPLWEEPEEDKPKPWKYWKLKSTEGPPRVKIEETKFYILRSKEKVRVPEGVAIYCRASDETIGEMRIHYAGFVHPMFGKCRTDGTQGTPLTFEVRGHQVDVSLADEERLANLTFYRMSMDHTRREGDKTSYDDQSLELSKFFGKWPENLRRNADGTVEPA